MNKAEKDVRDFYHTYTSESIQAEIIRDELSLRRHFNSIRQLRFQEQIESRIRILRAMVAEKLIAEITPDI